MAKRLFLAKIKDSDDRDVVYYASFEGFECDHYFSGLYLEGACFSGFKEELAEIVYNDFSKLETILTRDEFIRLLELDDKIDKLGYGITKGDDRYNEGLAICKEYDETIGTRLASEDNEQLFQKVIADEKEYCKQTYNLTDDEIEEIFDNYCLEYQDRAIIGYVFRDFDEMVEEEKISLGYDKIPYFNDEDFGRDLLESDNYLELESGRIVSYCY